MILKNQYEITVDLKRQIAMAHQTPIFVQNDSAVILVKIQNGGKPYDYSNVDRYVVSFKRPDGVLINGLGEYDTVTQMVKYELGSNEMEVAGSLETVVQLYVGEVRVTTRPFNIKILKDYEGGEHSQKDLTLLQELFIEVDQVKTDVIAAGDYATGQGDYAKGIRANFGHKGEYDNTKVYKDGNVVSYGGINYMCILETTAGINPLNGTYWTVVSPQATINEQTWTATEGQRTFTLANGKYVVGKGNIEVWVGGVPQIKDQGYGESSETTITLTEGVPAGTIVYAKWFEGHMYIAKGHKSGHELGGQDEIDVTQLRNFKEKVTDEITRVDELLAEKTNFNYVDDKDKLENSSLESLINSYRNVDIPVSTTRTILTTSASPHAFFPAIVKTASNKLIAYYRKGSIHEVDTTSKIYSLESTDDGVTWTNEKIVVANTGFDPRDPNVLLLSDGRIALKWFDHDGANVIPKVKVSSDAGVTFGSEVIFPSPPSYSGNAIATKGNFAVINSEIFVCLYTSGNKAYVVKSSDLTNWSFVSYISETIGLNETSLVYLAGEKALYAISRQGKQTKENVIIKDYANKLFLSKSYDNGLTWELSYELPIYGHAPSAVASDGEIILTYKNTYTLANGGNYTLDIVKIKNGKISGYPKTLKSSASTHDQFYSDVFIKDSNVYIIYYGFWGTSSAVYLISMPKTELNKITFLVTATLTNSIGSEGWRQTRDGTIEVWKEHTLNYNLAANEKKVFILTSPKSFPTRPLGITSHIVETTDPTNQVFDNVIVNARLLNAAGNIQVMLWNTNATSVYVSRLRTYTFGM